MSIDGPPAKDVHGPEHPQSVGYTRARKTVFHQDGPPFQLAAGGRLAPVEVEYETYGALNPARDNAVFICHALTGDAHAAGWDEAPDGPLKAFRGKKPGWWDDMVGPGKPIDTRRFFVVCANVLGSCYGTTGPMSLNPATGRPYGLAFPVVTVADWAALGFKLLDHLGVDRLHAAVGGSMGGQQALEMALAQPDRVANLIILSAGFRLGAQGLAFNAVARYSIINDSGFKNGDYYGGPGPLAGLSTARMLAHITYLSEESLGHKFGRRLQGKDKPDFTPVGVEFEVESYLQHQAGSFVARYDANSYLYMTRAVDYYDASTWGDGDLTRAAARLKARSLVASFSSDWLYPPELCRELVSAMCRAGRAVTYVDIPSRYGHDAFLVETETVSRLIRGFLRP
ncbi:MAG: homoserine O-acetyltransferase [Candidatus Adiutrix sp.]|jgi:homoserine O-acetyltransferase|nr:homoserine O-acetyltransferase [Candidatus Adiutrix sp.]